MKLTKVVYIASPYSGKSRFKFINWFIKLKRYRQITSIIGRLQEKYKYAFIGPITQSHNTSKYMTKPDSGFAFWELRDLSYVSRCDEVWVVLMPGWNESIGVLSEIVFANSLDSCKVKYINPKTLEFVKGTNL